MHPVVLVFLALAALPLGWMALYVFKDVRGARRNARHCCYACGKKMRFPTVAARHVPKGPAPEFLFCRPCARMVPTEPDFSYFILLGIVVIGAVVYTVVF